VVNDVRKAKKGSGLNAESGRGLVVRGTAGQAGDEERRTTHGNYEATLHH
jgi:hypothetical protein